MKSLSINKVRNYYSKGDFRLGWVINEIKKLKILDNLKKSSEIDKDVQQSYEKLWNRSKYSTI